MRKDIRYVICLVFIILLALLCIYRILADKEIEEEKKDPDITNVSPIPTPRTIVLPGDEDKFLGTVRYYTVKLSQKNIESVESVVGQDTEVTPKLICEYIKDALEDEEIDIDINDIQQKDGICTIDLSKDIVSVAAKDAALEKLILDAFSMSIIDNCADVVGVSFKIDNAPYSTANLKLQDGEVYLKN